MRDRPRGFHYARGSSIAIGTEDSTHDPHYTRYGSGPFASSSTPGLGRMTCPFRVDDGIIGLYLQRSYSLMRHRGATAMSISDNAHYDMLIAEISDLRARVADPKANAYLVHAQRRLQLLRDNKEFRR